MHSTPGSGSAVPDMAPSRAIAWLVLALMALANFGNYYVYDSIGPVADLLQRQRDFSDSQIGMLNAIYSLPNVVLILLGGILVDRYGTGRMLVWTGVICLAGTALTAWSPSFGGRLMSMQWRSEALTLTLATLLAGSLQAGTLPVGARAEQFTLKVVNVEKVDKRILALGHLVGEGAKEPKKLVVLSFFATYCEPCKKELPFLEELYKRYSDQGLGVLVVSIDKDKDVPGGAAKAVGALAEQHGGDVAITPRDGGGTVVRVRLPLGYSLNGDATDPVLERSTAGK